MIHNYTFAFQPIVDTDAAVVKSYEALVRGPQNQPAAWVLEQYKGEDLLQFDLQARKQAIALAEKLGLSTELNLNLLPECLAAFGAEGLQTTLDAAQACGFANKQMVLEVSESLAIKDMLGFVATANHFRAQGVKFAIDDFGAGYAGLNMLAEFQPDSIKIDLSLVRDVWYKGPRQAIARGIIRTCEDLGIDIVAEGVEAIDEYEWLRGEGVTLFQGHLFARPGFQSLPEVTFPA